jgi:hypothetical protein
VMPLSAAFAMLIGSTACSSPVGSWAKPGTSYEQFETDRADCLNRTDEYLATGERRPNYTALDQCMRSRGYVSAPQR